jgi:hypothetical protein
VVEGDRVGERQLAREWPLSASAPQYQLARRRAYLFGTEIWPQEVYLLTGILLMTAFGLFLASLALKNLDLAASLTAASRQPVARWRPGRAAALPTA